MIQAKINSGSLLDYKCSIVVYIFKSWVQALAEKTTGLETAQQMFIDYQKSVNGIKESAETVKVEKEVLEGEKAALLQKNAELEAQLKKAPQHEFKTPDAPASNLSDLGMIKFGIFFLF